MASKTDQEREPAPAENRRPRRRMDFLDVRTPFFRPLWRRVVAVALCLGWALYEISTGAVFWSILFGAAGLHLAWQFFVIFDRDENAAPEPPSKQDSGPS